MINYLLLNLLAIYAGNELDKKTITLSWIQDDKHYCFEYKQKSDNPVLCTMKIDSNKFERAATSLSGFDTSFQRWKVYDKHIWKTNFDANFVDYGIQCKPLDDLPRIEGEKFARFYKTKYKLNGIEDKSVGEALDNYYSVKPGSVVKFMEREYKRNGTFNDGPMGGMIKGFAKNYYYDAAPLFADHFQIHILTDDKKMAIFDSTYKRVRDKTTNAPLLQLDWEYEPIEILQDANFSEEFMFFPMGNYRLYVTRTGKMYMASESNTRASIKIRPIEETNSFPVFHILTVDSEQYLFAKDPKNPRHFKCFYFVTHRMQETDITFDAPHFDWPRPLLDSRNCYRMLVIAKIIKP